MLRINEKRSNKVIRIHLKQTLSTLIATIQGQLRKVASGVYVKTGASQELLEAYDVTQDEMDRCIDRKASIDIEELIQSTTYDVCDLGLDLLQLHVEATHKGLRIDEDMVDGGESLTQDFMNSEDDDNHHHKERVFCFSDPERDNNNNNHNKNKKNSFYKARRLEEKKRNSWRRKKSVTKRTGGSTKGRRKRRYRTGGSTGDSYSETEETESDSDYRYKSKKTKKKKKKKKK